MPEELQLTGQKVNIWVAVAPSDSLDCGKQATMGLKPLNAWVKVHRRLRKNQTHHSRCGRCGAPNECVQLKLFIYLDEQWTPQE